MSTPYIGEIRIFAGNFAPVGWLLCQGQLLPISQYDVLFNLIGTTYGGDGQNTFALPNLASRIPYHQGSGYVLGQQGGAEDVTLTVSQIPQHSHTANVDENFGTQLSPTNNILAQTQNPLMYRSITNPVLWQIFYALIIAAEAVAGILFLAGAIRLMQMRNASETSRRRFGSAFSSAFDTASSVPSAALMIVDDVVFSGI